jgi:hypothetical protein
LPTDINQEWDNIFNYLERYGWGYLPSYDRHLEWQDLSIYLSKRLLPVTQLGCDLIEKIYNISIPNDYRFMSDFYCNYIGFQSRQHLEEYVNFYMPLINFLFDSSYQPIDDLSKYVGSTKSYRKEKPFTFYLEIISHLFFYTENINFFGMHYDGYYEINERNTSTIKLAELKPGLFSRIFLHRYVVELKLKRLLDKLLSIYPSYFK